MDGIGEVQGVERYQKISYENSNNKASEYGKTVGKPELSDTAKKYYEQLKKKYGNYDFILVSSEEKENAKANAAKYANGFKTVVLIGEEEIEKMATDENFRKKYEDILSGADARLQQLKASMDASGANVAGYGIQINDDGTSSFFAVLKKSSAEQKARIEKKIEESRNQRKEEAKEASEERLEKKIKENRENIEERYELSDDNFDILSAGTLEELMKKISDYSYEQRANTIQTDAEKLVGQNIDFRG